MAALNLAQIAAAMRWRLQRWARQPWAGPAMLMFALSTLAASSLWCWRAVDQLRIERVARELAGTAAPQPQAGASPTQLQLQQFIDTLPSSGDAPVAVQSLLDLAEREGLRLLRGSYRLQPEPAARFGRYRMTLPVRGEPARVQRFIQAALLTMPALSIESIQFKREDDTGRILEARIQWVLFVRTEGTPQLKSTRAANAAPTVAIAPKAATIRAAVAPETAAAT